MDDELHRLRANIDAVDDELLALLSRRSAYVEEVGRVKKAHGVHTIIRPGREMALIRKAATASAACGLSAESLSALWRIIIAASSQLEQEITLGIAPSANDTFAQLMIQAFYGSFTPKTIFDSTPLLLDAIANRTITVGVFAANDTLLGQELLKHSRLKIFAALPFIAQSNTPSLYIVGEVTPEPGGDDISLFLSHNQMISVTGFTQTLSSQVDAVYMGSYSQPILIES